jgi:hypothetical protein
MNLKTIIDQLMKTNTKLAVASLMLAAVLNAAAQVASNVTFTRITTGAIVTDSAYSFGCAWGDYDGDGFLDLIVGNGLGDANALYHNNGDGTFTRTTNNAITTTIGDASGVTWGDYDNDGRLDLFVANWQIPSFLFRNLGGGNFARITSGSIATNFANSDGCSWADYDNDGFLDLIVANNSGQNPFLYHNDGSDTFSQIVSGPVATSAGFDYPAWADYDSDGRMDLLMVGGNLSSGQHVLFHNDGEGIFTRVTTPPTGSHPVGAPAWGDYDNDGDLDLFVAERTHNVADLLYRNDGGGVFTPITTGPLPNSGGSSQQCLWGDYDNDGWLDLFVINTVGQLPFLFHNDGGGSFTRITQGALVNLAGTNIGGANWADYDNDGFLDLFVARGVDAVRTSNVLFHNDGNSNKWLQVVCAGRASNRLGIGAKVRARALIAGTSRWQLRDISSGDGFQSCRLRAHFGLGDATNVDLIRIEWPSGIVQELRNVAVNQILTVTEPPRLEAVGRQPDGSLQLRLTGGVGFEYTLETSSDLVTWTQWGTVENIDRTILVVDSSTTNVTTRFYRAVAFCDCANAPNPRLCWIFCSGFQ